ncbi:MAG: hypothetical protein KDJ52_25960 [Anaerolineae bacterium]|nr:hypothetical protein [Anaerolineae bacterium]
MKKLWVILSVSLLVLVTAVTAYAQSAEPVEIGLAITPNVQQCAANVELADGSIYTLQGTYEVTAVENAEDDIMFSCQGTLTTDPSQFALRAEGTLNSAPFFCWTGDTFVKTQSWSIDITPAGGAMYTCGATIAPY